MLRLTRRLLTWEIAVHMAAADGVFDGDIFLCFYFSHTVFRAESLIELCLFL